jgi:O-acetylhomoserine/O-acetylserine sulfhydrylase-like pyridoxal-dependent enzyme
VHTLGRQLAALEDTEAAYAVASGEGQRFRWLQLP